MKNYKGSMRKISLLIFVLAVAIAFGIHNHAIAAVAPTATTTAANQQAAVNMAGSIGANIGNAAGAVAGTTMQQFLQLKQTATAAIATAQALTQAKSAIGILIANPGLGAKAVMDQAIASLNIDAIMAAANQNLEGQRAAAGQATAVGALDAKNNMALASYNANAARQGVLMGTKTNLVSKYTNVAEAGCFHATNGAALQTLNVYAKEKGRENFAKSSAILNGTAPESKNGEMDMINQIWPQVLAACNSQVLGGELDDCTNAVQTTLTKPYAFTEESMTPGQQAAVDIQNQMIFAAFTVPKSLNPSLLKGADLETKRIVVNELARTTLASIAANEIGTFMGNKSQSPGPVKAIQYIREVLTNSGAITAEEVDKLLPSAGTSLYGYVSAFVLALNEVNLMSRISDATTASVVTAQIAGLQAWMANETMMLQARANAMTAVEILLRIDEKKQQGNQDIAKSNAGV